MTDKDKLVKLQKKLQQRKLAIYEALQQEVVLQWLKTSNPAFLSMLTPETMIEIINLLIIPGPPNDKIRSYKIPMIAAQLLSSMLPKIYQLLFQEDPQQKGHLVLNRLLKYFDTTPNYVISGYVAKILLNIFPPNPSRALEIILKSQPERMINFVESQSIAEFMTRVIIVEDALLNVQIKERVALFGEVVTQYIENKRSEDELVSLNWMLIEAINRLWTLKHKQLGRYSGTLFRLVEAVIDHNNLYQQESMIVAICKQVSVYQKQAPFLIAALYKKIQQELSLGRGDSQGTKKPKLTSKRFKHLQALFFIVSQGSEAIVKQLSSHNVFTIILDYIIRYQWHSLALIQIQKTLKAAINSSTQAVFQALNRSYFPDKIKQYARIQQSEGKNGCGFCGLLFNIATALKQSLDNDTGYGGWLKKSQAEGDLLVWLSDHITKKKGGEQKMRVVHQVAKPFYSVSKLTVLFKQFFDQTEAINQRMLYESPSKHQIDQTEQKEMREQIQKQNEMVYKWMSQLTNEVLPEDKKPEESCE